MCSIKATINLADGTQQTIVRSVEKGAGDVPPTSDLAVLRTHMGEVQAELNAVLTVVVDKQKAAGGKIQNSKQSGDQEDEEADDDDDDDDDETNGSPEPPQKIRKTSS